MLYLGHKCEAFCLSLAEAQALGVPAVIAPVAVLPERVIDGLTGFHRSDAERFAEAAVALLTMNSHIDVRDVLPSIQCPAVVMHRIDETSPLRGETPGSLAAKELELQQANGGNSALSDFNTTSRLQVTDGTPSDFQAVETAWTK
jgi:hypothetical protein